MSRLSRPIMAVLAVLAVAATPLASGPAIAAEELVLAFIPQENPEKLLGDIDVISAWLAEETGVAVSGFVTNDHAAAVEALRNGDADISFMGALPYVLARREIGARVILSEVYRGSPVYTGRIFVRRDSGLTTVGDLAGKTIAFADPISESGYLYPLDIFVDAGFMKRGDDARVFFDRVYFAGGYQQAMQAMANGLVDAAGASQFAELLLSPQQQADITWIAETAPIPSHTVIARADLDPDLEARFVAAMLRLNEPELRPLLKHLYSTDGYIIADPAAYDGVAEVARAYDLID
ncbi:MAG: phosphate/phosphite/phosphonate ABC transporter substrate-binding protein [Alphaproteobacteria bacterium]